MRHSESMCCLCINRTYWYYKIRHRPTEGAGPGSVGVHNQKRYSFIIILCVVITSTLCFSGEKIEKGYHKIRHRPTEGAGPGSVGAQNVILSLYNRNSV